MDDAERPVEEPFGPDEPDFTDVEGDEVPELEEKPEADDATSTLA